MATNHSTHQPQPCYATLYEEGLVNYNESKKKEGDNNDIQVLLARAQRRGGLQVAAADKTNCRDLAFVQQLLHQTTLEMDQDAILEPSKETADLFKSVDLSKLKEQQQDEQVDVDFFFDQYPECVRQDVAEESDSSDDEDDKELYAMRKRPATTNEKQVPAAADVVEIVDAPPQAQQPPPQQQPPPPVNTNPYAKNVQPSSYPQPQQRNDPNNNNNNNKASWDEFRNQQNPFQTAREYHNAGGNEQQQAEEQTNYSSNTQQPYRGPPPPQQQQQQQQYPVNNPYERNNNNPYAAPDQQQQPPPGGPNIPQSLKRKFQPPKRGGSVERGGGGGIKKKTATDERPSNDNDDELPEALKGLDKELVDKIQNEILESGDTVTFDDIAGLEDAKQTVQELVCWPMKRPDLFTGLRRGPNGLLLFGPPGTGKTLIGKAIAHESGATFFSISSSSLTSKWIGEGEKLVRTLFAVAAFREPAVVFIDEIDSLLTQRKSDENEASRRIKTEFLVQLDGTGTSGQGRVLVIGATNRPHELDDAARRRFVKRLYIPLPDEPDRVILLRHLLGTNNHSLAEECFAKLGKDTAGYSGADLKALCVDAAMGPLRELGTHALEIRPEDVPPISFKHFRRAMRGMNPSVAQADLEIYLEWNKTYGSKRSGNIDDESDDED